MLLSAGFCAAKSPGCVMLLAALGFVRRIIMYRPPRATAPMPMYLYLCSSSHGMSVIFNFLWYQKGVKRGVHNVAVCAPHLLAHLSRQLLPLGMVWQSRVVVQAL